MILPSKRKGFTILEMTIVFIVMSILLSIGYFSYAYYIGLAKATRLNNTANAIMSGARLTNALHNSKGLGPNHLLTQNDGNATFGWPSSAYVCNVIEQSSGSGPSTGLTPTSYPISCSNGVLQDISIKNTNCKATYHEATATTSAYVDTSLVTPGNCSD